MKMTEFSRVILPLQLRGDVLHLFRDSGPNIGKLLSFLVLKVHIGGFSHTSLTLLKYMYNVVLRRTRPGKYPSNTTFGEIRRRTKVLLLEGSIAGINFSQRYRRINSNRALGHSSMPTLVHVLFSLENHLPSVVPTPIPNPSITPPPPTHTHTHTRSLL